MKEIQELEVSITTDGRLSVEVHGVKGPRCLELTRELEDALGGEIVERRHTFEYDQATITDKERDRLRRGD